MADLTDTVIVIDDDLSVRESLEGLLQSVRLRSQVYSSIPHFLQADRPNGPFCLVLDATLPGKSGFEFQHELAEAGIRIPIIFITGYGDSPMTAQAIENGAVACLTKPFRDQDLLDAIYLGLQQDRSRF